MSLEGTVTHVDVGSDAHELACARDVLLESRLNFAGRRDDGRRGRGALRWADCAHQPPARTCGMASGTASDPMASSDVESHTEFLLEILRFGDGAATDSTSP